MKLTVKQLRGLINEVRENHWSPEEQLARRDMYADAFKGEDVPEDYEECGYCGYDHGYDPSEAAEWHRKNDPDGELYEGKPHTGPGLDTRRKLDWQGQYNSIAMRATNAALNTLESETKDLWFTLEDREKSALESQISKLIRQTIRKHFVPKTHMDM